MGPRLRSWPSILGHLPFLASYVVASLHLSLGTLFRVNPTEPKTNTQGYVSNQARKPRAGTQFARHGRVITNLWAAGVPLPRPGAGDSVSSVVIEAGLPAGLSSEEWLSHSAPAPSRAGIDHPGVVRGIPITVTVRPLCRSLAFGRGNGLVLCSPLVKASGKGSDVCAATPRSGGRG